MVWKKLFGGGSPPSPPAPQPASEADQVGWTPSNALEETMAQIPDSVEAQFAFARQLLESNVLLATANKSETDGARTLESDESFSIISVDDNLGGTAAAMFTSEARLAAAFGEGAPYVAMNGRVALEAVAGIGTIINPGPGLYVTYQPPVIERILSGNI